MMKHWHKKMNEEQKSKINWITPRTQSGGGKRLIELLLALFVFCCEDGRK